MGVIARNSKGEVIAARAGRVEHAIDDFGT